MFSGGMAERDTMRRGTAGALLLVLLMPGLAGCGSDWQPSWSTSSRPAVTGNSLTIRRVLGDDPAVEPLRHEDSAAIRLDAGTLEPRLPAVPDLTPAAPAPRPARRGSSTPPPGAAVPPPAVLPALSAAAARDEKREGREHAQSRVVMIPGQPPAVLADGAGRVRSVVQPGNPAGGVAIREGGTTTIIEPGGRVTTVSAGR
jgi:hypothetical protein